MKDLLAELTHLYDTRGLDGGTELLPPAADAEIDRLGERLGVPIPASLRELWRTYGGQRHFGAGVSGLFGQHRLLTPGESAEAHHLIWDCESDEVPRGTPARLFNRPVPELIPFAVWDAYMLCVHATTAEVFEYLPSPGLLREWKSTEAALLELIGEVRAGRDAALRWEDEE